MRASLSNRQQVISNLRPRVRFPTTFLPPASSRSLTPYPSTPKMANEIPPHLRPDIDSDSLNFDLWSNIRLTYLLTPYIHYVLPNVPPLTNQLNFTTLDNRLDSNFSINYPTVSTFELIDSLTNNAITHPANELSNSTSSSLPSPSTPTYSTSIAPVLDIEPTPIYTTSTDSSPNTPQIKEETFSLEIVDVKTLSTEKRPTTTSTRTLRPRLREATSISSSLPSSIGNTPPTRDGLSPTIKESHLGGEKSDPSKRPHAPNINAKKRRKTPQSQQGRRTKIKIEQDTAFPDSTILKRRRSANSQGTLISNTLLQHGK